MPKPPTPAAPSSVLLTLQREAKRQGMTAYAIAKAQGMRISTVQRALDGEVSPSLATLEAIAAALGLEIKAERKG